jgi:uncharacterized protein YqeY
MKQQLQDALKLAMKAKDKIKLETIRGVLSAVQYEAMEKKVDDLPNDGILAVLQRELKRRKEEAEFAVQAGRAEMIEKLKAESAVIESFLPKQLPTAELEKIITDLKASTPGLAMGAAMKHLKENFGGQYDSKAASDLCKKIFG